MSKAIDNLIEAQQLAIQIRPKVGGFPVLAEVLRLAGVKRNSWVLPSCQSIYYTELGCVVQQGTPLITTATEVPSFNREALIGALRRDQAGEGSFPEFLKSSWEAGVIAYDVDFEAHTCTYFGSKGESYTEHYPAVNLKKD